MVNPHFNPNEDASGPPSPQALRQRAEASLLTDPRANIECADALPVQEAPCLIHDLLVHQNELEMQKEELRRAQAELTALQTHYFDLFDLAPVGYVSPLRNPQGAAGCGFMSLPDKLRPLRALRAPGHRP